MFAPIIPTAATSLQRYQKPYAGVVVFCLPCALEGGMNIDDTTTFRVSVFFFTDLDIRSSYTVDGINNYYSKCHLLYSNI